MCTVTYLPFKYGCFLTSSRDESIARPKALAPEVYHDNHCKIIYPKDAKANGSWIAVAENGNAAILLNGAFVKHIARPPYRKSRGLILLDVIASAIPELYFLEMDLNNIEPFTLVLFIHGFLFEARWDGAKKYLVQLDEKENHIWSSATLYTPETAAKRSTWFEKWTKENKDISAAAVLKFHRFAGDGDSSNSVLMNRDNEMLTVSITGIEMRLDAATMHHLDVIDNLHSIKTIQLQTVAVSL